MGMKANQGLPFARMLMVVSSLSPLFLLWALRGAPPVPDCYWIGGCLAMALLPNLALLWRWRIAKRRNDHRAIVVENARDQSDHLLVYLFAMLLPLYSVNLVNIREIAAVVAAFVFIVFLFWHMNLHYMNLIFAVLNYRVYTVQMSVTGTTHVSTVVLLSKRLNPPAAGQITGLRLSDTVYVEKEGA